ncbi:hypothetical protein A3J61_02160 [Candidatus Nomurabacteria bacterium RIFCSPHIGHO2_02_FULL_38_15]|uniref:HIT domain-containing protein n=1 Tax=Candidatus Nomurabacteria bacterium RIFCSPHIGHO2_02_FULL_38_15 TaxID=1801752 RepID=A0A1F6VRT2_9BACT|nr:MAG: hypothetical protein A3J61_02160 [Candidatus Nomurabacteria bacterium RIFCSPHIGHO2_02_FULL_38_15]
MEKTIFEKIIDNEIPAQIIYEDDRVIGILDTNPVNIGHTLVIPKYPWANIYEIPAEDFGYAMQITQMLAIKIKSALDAEGINIIMNNDSVAGQVVFHAHIHIVPRYTGDGHQHWHGARKYEDGEAELVAEKIIEA